jgi:hypothetical protein
MRKFISVFMTVFFVYLLALALIFAVGAVAWLIPSAPTPQGDPGRLLIARPLYGLLALLFGFAAWTALRDRRSYHERARRVLFMASLLSLVITLGLPVVLGRGLRRAALSIECVFGLPTLIGVGGVIVFRRRRSPAEDARGSQ